MPRRLAWPVTVTNDGQLATVEQDSDQDITQCLRALLRTRIGDRPDLPDMGLVSGGEFGEQPLDLSGHRELWARHEPRATVLLSQQPSLENELVAEIRAEWDLVPEIKQNNA